VTPAASVSNALAAELCAICGAPDPLGTVLCSRCAGGAPEVADTLVVIRGAERAYARVPGALAPRVVERLGALGRPARAVPAAHAWRALPARTWLLVESVVVAGVVATRVAAPQLWWTTVVVAAALLAAATRAMRRPLLAPRDVPALPAPLERRVAETFAALPPGESRALLALVVQPARALFTLDGTAASNDDRPLARDVGELVAACCELALAHARLEEGDPGAPPDRAQEGADRVEATRALLARRLRDAASAARDVYAQQVTSDSGPAARVAELAAELTAEAGARRHADEAIRRLLA
jgi:hypothetical protein